MCIRKRCGESCTISSRAPASKEVRTLLPGYGLLYTYCRLVAKNTQPRTMRKGSRLRGHTKKASPNYLVFFFFFMARCKQMLPDLHNSKVEIQKGRVNSQARLEIQITPIVKAKKPVQLFPTWLNQFRQHSTCTSLFRLCSTRSHLRVLQKVVYEKVVH